MTAYIVAIEHPSLVRLVRPFAESIHDESRRFGPVASTNPKPFPSLIRKVVARDRRRFGAVDDGRLIGMTSLAADGELAMAVVAERRGEGVGTLLMGQAIDDATACGIGRLRMESSHRSSAVARLTARLGWTAVDMGRGRVDLYLDVARRGVG